MASSPQDPQLTYDRYELLFERNVAGVFRSKLDGRILECNQALADMFGYDSPEDLKQMSATDLYESPEDREKFIADLREDGALTNYEHRQRRTDGEPIWVLENCALVQDPDTDEQTIVGAMIDITDRKRAHQERQAAEERYRRLFEHNVAGVFRVALDGRIMDCNPAFARMFGYDSPEDLEDVPAVSLYADEEDRREFRDLLESRGSVTNFELRLRRKGGSLLWGLENSHLAVDPETGDQVVEGTLIDITERKQLEAELERRAYHDPLTGLPNRRLLREKGAQAIALADRQEGQVGLLFLDLERFKLVNDSFGHSAGDHVLVEVGKRLEARLRSADTAARVGGDEFVALLSDVDGEEGALEAAGRIRSIFRTPFHVGQDSIHLDARMGLALYPDHAGDMDQLLSRADRAVVHGDVIDTEVAIYSPESDERPTSELTLAEELRRALEDEEFQLHYQPVYRVDSGALVGAEALIRWATGPGTIRTAGQFVPTAERAGLVARLDRWTLREAVEQIRKWDGPDDPDWVAVNLSAQSFAEPDFPEFLRDLLGDVDFARERLVLEMTERTAMRDPARTVETVQALRDLGVRTAIDDFGTGYSALAHLKHYPADLMKIDMLFIRHIHREAQNGELVEAIVSLGHALGSEVVAEGVENEDELEWLGRTRCDYAQGFFLGEPGPADELRTPDG